MQRSKGWLFWPVLIAVAAADRVSKKVATNSLSQFHGQREVFRTLIRWTFVQNPGAAFGLQVGGPGASRWVFMALTIVALGILARLYINTRDGDQARTLALALVCGGAIGNLVDRVTSASGVVDFIDVGYQNARWPTFNLADSAVCIGACLLAWVLWDEEREGMPVASGPAALSG
jgi:signal peptidase II